VCDKLMDVGTVDVKKLSAADVDALGDSVLAHAVRRMRQADDAGRAQVGEPIAAFQDCM
jgi:FXSXX-COOH protein